MNIAIPGASGPVGGVLARAVRTRGDDVAIVAWDARTRGPWAAELDGADAVINLAGRSVKPPLHAGEPRRDAALARRPAWRDAPRDRRMCHPGTAARTTWQSWPCRGQRELRDVAARRFAAAAAHETYFDALGHAC